MTSQKVVKQVKSFLCISKLAKKIFKWLTPLTLINTQNFALSSKRRCEKLGQKWQIVKKCDIGRDFRRTGVEFEISETRPSVLNIIVWRVINYNLILHFFEICFWNSHSESLFAYKCSWLILLKCPCKLYLTPSLCPVPVNQLPRAKRKSKKKAIWSIYYSKRGERLSTINLNHWLLRAKRKADDEIQCSMRFR